MERLQAEQAEMLDHERTKREEWESVQVLHFLPLLKRTSCQKFTVKCPPPITSQKIAGRERVESEGGGEESEGLGGREAEVGR